MPRRVRCNGSFGSNATGLAFAVPNALGVQGAAYTQLTSLVGVGKEIGLAVSLLKRARDIAIGAPIVLIWRTLKARECWLPGIRERYEV